MPYTGLGRHDDPGPGHLCPPAEVEILPHRHDGRIESADHLEEVGPNQHTPAGREEHVPHRVVLPVIDLVGVHTIDDRAALVDGHPDVDQPLGVVPAHDLRRDDPGVRPERLLDQEVDRVGQERDVVVAEEVVGGAVDHRADLVDRGPEASVLVEAAHVRGRQHRGHPGGEVAGAGRVEHEHRELPVILGGERGQGLFEPRARIVGDDDGDNRRSRCFHQGSEAIGPTPPFGGQSHPIRPDRRLGVLATVYHPVYTCIPPTASGPPAGREESSVREITTDVGRTAKDIATVVADATYVVIGAAVLGFQRAQVRRQELNKRIAEPRTDLEDRVASIRSDLNQALTGLDSRVEEIADRVEDLIGRLETVVAPFEDRLPTQARDLVRQAHDQAREARSQIRTRLPNAAA